MTLRFRNVDAHPDDPVASWPTEAIETALARGDLDDWRRIAAEVRRDPWGRTARQVEEVLGHTRPYGVAELMEALLDRCRAEREAEERTTVAAEIRAAVEESGLTMREFASRVGTSGSRLSTYAGGGVTPSATMLLRIRRLAARTRAAEDVDGDRQI